MHGDRIIICVPSSTSHNKGYPRRAIALALREIALSGELGYSSSFIRNSKLCL